MKKQSAMKNGEKKVIPLAKPKLVAPGKFESSRFPNVIYAVIIAFCFCLYGNTMLNQYALDDTMVLTQNQFVKDGVGGIPKIFQFDTFIGRYGGEVTNLPGGRYRPLSVATLAVEYELFVHADVKKIIEDKLDATKTQYTVPRKYLSKEESDRLDSIRANEIRQLNEWRATALSHIDTVQHPQAVVDIIAQYNEALTQITPKDSITYTKSPTELNKNDDDAQLYMKTWLPYVNHFMNILLFALTACFLFKLLLRLFPVREASGWKLLFNIPVIATLLFIAHPVHVEAVANIKGRDEIMTFLGALMALFYTLRWFDTKNKKFLLVTFICFLAGVFSKENALTFLVLIPLTLYFFTSYKFKPVLVMTILMALPVFLLLKADIFVSQKMMATMPWTQMRAILLPGVLTISIVLSLIPIIITIASKQYSAWRNVGMALLPSFIAALIFTFVRYNVINMLPAQETELMNNPFLNMNSIEKWSSIIYVLGRYLWLLIWPHPLTTDYYPYHIPKMTAFDMEVWLSFFVYLAMAIFTVVWGLSKTKKNKYAYAIVWYIVPLTIVSNIFVMIGTFMNERFIYISSVGFCLAVACFLVLHLPKWVKNIRLYHYAVIALLLVVLSLYSIQTISRNKVWFDDFTLSTTDVKTSPKSAKANYDAARVYNIKIQGETDSTKRKLYVDEIFKYSQRAVQIHPNYENALYLLAGTHSDKGSPVDTSVKYLKQLLRRNAQNGYAYDFLTQLLAAKIPDPAKRAAVWEDLINTPPLNPRDARIADQFQPNYNLACVYAKDMGVNSTGQFVISNLQKSLPYFERARQLNPNYVNGLIDLGAMYGNLGRHLQAINIFVEASQKAPNEPLVWRNLWITYNALGDAQKAQEAYDRYVALGGTI